MGDSLIMVDYLLHSLPVVAALVVYFVRVEVKLAVMQRDLCWIKESIRACPPTSEESMT